MSSQGDNGIPLVHAPTGLGYRLLELPPELLELLESDNPPIFKLEASETAALLRTEDKTYSLRQKNTSNALFILSSQIPPVSLSRLPDPQSSAAAGGRLAAVATVHETVELVPETAGEGRGGKREGDIGKPAPAPPLRGKWHEKFGRTR